MNWSLDITFQNDSLKYDVCSNLLTVDYVIIIIIIFISSIKTIEPVSPFFLVLRV